MTLHEFDWSAEPACSLGYSGTQLRELLGGRYPAFIEFMLVKANPICTGPDSAAPGSGPRSSCAESHG